MTTNEEQSAPSPKDDFSQAKGFDYVELYVSNARQAAHFYTTAFGFTQGAYCGLETGVRDRVSFLVSQGSIRLVLTNALDPYSPIAEHVKLHGDSIKDIAFAVNNAACVFEEAVRRGARPVMEPTLLEDESGRVVKATIGAYGDTVHSFVERSSYDGVFLP